LFDGKACLQPNALSCGSLFSEVLGFHAWAEALTSKGLKLVLETTVHPKSAKPILAELVYKGKLDITLRPNSLV
jgi:hypothetical protein